MKLVTIIGARPQFIKAAVVSRALRQNHSEILVHTGQHYDANMSDVFFEELGIPSPDYNLGIGSGNHGEQTGAMLAGIEKVLLAEKPDWVLVYGDTNSTLAGALAASKLHIRVAHVEAGLRSFNRQMPEEINRILTDHISDALFCPTQTAVDHLLKEGITAGVSLTGDVMYTALKWAFAQSLQKSAILPQNQLIPKEYYLATVHRAENTDHPARLQEILKAFDALDRTLVFPVHPRTRKKLAESGWSPKAHVRLIDPLGYLDMACLEGSARLILTDSGGIQKEAAWLGVPCVTLRDETEWVETVETGWNQLAGSDYARILAAVKNQSNHPQKAMISGEQDPAGQIIQALVSASSNQGENTNVHQDSSKR